MPEVLRPNCWRAAPVHCSMKGLALLFRSALLRAARWELYSSGAFPAHITARGGYARAQTYLTIARVDGNLTYPGGMSPTAAAAPAAARRRERLSV